MNTNHYAKSESLILALLTTLTDSNYYWPLLAKGRNKTQRSYVTCPSLFIKKMAVQGGSDLISLTPKYVLFFKIKKLFSNNVIFFNITIL